MSKTRATMTPTSPSEEMIQITVGDPSALTIFNLPRYPLCTNVLVLSNMVTGYVKEGLPASLYFPQFDPSAFKTFTDWATTGTLHTLYTLDHKKSDPFDCWSWNPYGVYNIGEFFMLSEFMDKVMDCLVAALEERKRDNPREGYPPLETVSKVFSGAPPKSTMRELMVEIFCYNVVDGMSFDDHAWSDEGIVEVLEENGELMAEVVKKLRGCGRGRAEDPVKVSWEGEIRACRWHVHEGEISPGYECVVERGYWGSLGGSGEMSGLGGRQGWQT